MPQLPRFGRVGRGVPRFAQPSAKAEVLRRVPGYTIASLKANGYSMNPDFIRLAEAHFYPGLRKAGFPDR